MVATAVTRNFEVSSNSSAAYTADARSLAATTPRGLPSLIANSEYLSMLRCIIDGQIRSREQPLKLPEADAAHVGNQVATYRWKCSSHESCKQAPVEYGVAPLRLRLEVSRRLSEFAAGACLQSGLNLTCSAPSFAPGRVFCMRRSG
jgi:hypothetical protein